MTLESRTMNSTDDRPPTLYFKIKTQKNKNIPCINNRTRGNIYLQEWSQGTPPYNKGNYKPQKFHHHQQLQCNKKPHQPYYPRKQIPHRRHIRYHP